MPAGRRAGPAVCHSNARQYLDARAGPRWAAHSCRRSQPSSTRSARAHAPRGSAARLQSPGRPAARTAVGALGRVLACPEPPKRWTLSCAARSPNAPTGS